MMFDGYMLDEDVVWLAFLLSYLLILMIMFWKYPDDKFGWLLISALGLWILIAGSAMLLIAIVLKVT